MANHDSLNHNCSLSFVPLSRAEAMMLFPRIPTLRAHRPIVAGEEITFNYGTLTLTLTLSDPSSTPLP